MQALESIRVFFKHIDSLRLHFGHRWLTHLAYTFDFGVLVGFQDFATHFLDESLFQDVAYIDYFLILGDALVALGILTSCVIH
jgi:hypothetical protein